eukprot:scaffold183533_cov21-Tisochrysis_lutea.AAC.2
MQVACREQCRWHVGAGGPKGNTAEEQCMWHVRKEGAGMSKENTAESNAGGSRGRQKLLTAGTLLLLLPWDVCSLCCFTLVMHIDAEKGGLTGLAMLCLKQWRDRRPPPDVQARVYAQRGGLKQVRSLKKRVARGGAPTDAFAALVNLGCQPTKGDHPVHISLRRCEQRWCVASSMSSLVVCVGENGRVNGAQQGNNK